MAPYVREKRWQSGNQGCVNDSTQMEEKNQCLGCPYCAPVTLRPFGVVRDPSRRTKTVFMTVVLVND